MSTVRITTMAIIIVCVSICLAAQDTSSERLVVTEKDGAYELMVPVSRLSVTIPKGQLVPSKSGAGSDSPRYFSLQDPRGLVISGWFEPDQSFEGMDPFWAGEQRSLIQNGLKIQNVIREKIGKWQVVFYDVPLLGGRSSNMRAEWIQAGTWIDLHLSATADQSAAEGQKVLRSVLSEIQVKEKN